jgi:acyl transferase domain-containing protein
MKTKVIATTTLAAVFAFGVGGALQHVSANQTPKDDSAQRTPNSGMMGGGMMERMGEHHRQMSGLMDKLMASMASIQSEKDPEALKAKLADHQKLLDQMHGQMMQQGDRMKMMSGQMKQQCSDAGDASNAPTKQ